MAGLLRKVSITGLLWFISSVVMAEYYIGMTAGFTGPQGQDNLAYRYGVEAYFQQINRSGGIKGEEIELEVLDDEFSPDLAERNLMRFVTRKGVLAVLGGDMATASSLALAAQREKVLFLGSLSGHPTLYGNVKSVLNIRPSIAHEAEFLCRQMRTQGIRQATVVSPDESAEHIVELCGEHRVELTTVRYSASTLNFQNTIAAIQKLGHEHVILVGSSVGLNRLLDQAPATTLGFHTFWLPSLVDLTVVSNNIATPVNINQISFLPKNLEQTKAYQEYQRSLQQLNAYLVPTQRGFEGYLAGKILAIGLQDVVKPFEIENPSDFMKLPLNVARRLTGWVQTGKDFELQSKLINALSVMRSFDLGIGYYPGYQENENSLNWNLSILSGSPR